MTLIIALLYAWEDEYELKLVLIWLMLITILLDVLLLAHL